MNEDVAMRCCASGFSLRWSLQLALLSLFVSAACAQSTYSANLDVVRKSVVFLHIYDKAGKLTEVGTGFLLVVPTKSDRKLGYYLLVTARHMVDPVWMGCAEGSQTLSMVLNKKEYDPAKDDTGVIEIFLKNPPGIPFWTFSDDESADVAIAAVDSKTLAALPKENEPLQVSQIASDEEMHHVASGDPIVSAGLLNGASGTKRNQPIFKFGNVSSIPVEKIAVPCCPGCTNRLLTEWMIAASLVPGNSGSPIFYMPNGLMEPGAYNKRPFLMGVQSISFTGSDVAGMTPATFIMQIIRKLNLPDADIPATTNLTTPIVAVPSSNNLQVPTSPKPLSLPH